MELKHPFLIIFLTFFCFQCSTSMAFNITKILANITGYDQFNSLLSSSGLAQKINSRQTITVLAVKDGSVGSLSGQSKDDVQKVLSTHVILDYYDVDKLNNLRNKSSILTTLYQASGQADNQEGFLNVTKAGNGVLFGSAKKGAPLVASLVGSLVSQPYNISVLQVSNVIEASGSAISAAPSPPPPSAPAESPADAPASDDAPSSAPAADAPAADASGPAAGAPGPAADSPYASPPRPDSTEAADAPAEPPAKASASALRAGGVVAVVVVMAAGIVGI